MRKSIEPPCSDAAVKAKTGRDWSEWCIFLDSKDAMKIAHPDIARLINANHSGGGWWSQTVAVGYERLRGKRSLYQRSDGTYSANVSKTLPINADKAHAFFVDRRKSATWLEERIVVRRATAPKSARITWLDGSNVEVQITSKGKAKCVVAIEHSKLRTKDAASKQKNYWKAAFERLLQVVK